MAGHGVDDVDFMSVLGQPGRVDSFGTTDIEDLERPTGKVPPDHFLCPNKFELCEAIRDAASFVDRVVIVDDLVRKTRHPYMEPEWPRALRDYRAICSHGER
jgi:hypothetical protein